MSTLSELSMEHLAGHLNRHCRTSRPGHNFAIKAERPEKAAARRSVLSLFSLRNWPSGLSILTMPGMYWNFEKQLLANRERKRVLTTSQCAKSTFIAAIERDEAIYRAALKEIPGGAFGINSVPCFDYETACCFTPHIARFRRCSFEDYAKGAAGHPPIDAAWLDFNGQITEARIAAICDIWPRIRRYLIITCSEAHASARIGQIVKGAGSYGEMWRCLLPESAIVEQRRYRDTSVMNQCILRKQELLPKEGAE